jgi:hypothetical protein
VILNAAERQYCPECLPEFKDRRTEKLVRSARSVLAEMRVSPDDPARSPEAVAKRVVGARQTLKAEEGPLVYGQLQGGRGGTNRVLKVGRW